MSVSKLNRCIWLADLINSRGRVTKEEINQEWQLNSGLNPEHERVIPDRTFHKYINEISELLGINVLCDRSTNEYYIEGGRIRGLGYLHGISTIDAANRRMLAWETAQTEVTVRLSCIVEEAPRLREHPLHPSQTEVGPTDEGDIIFEYHMRPDLAFYEAISSLNTSVLILEPESLVRIMRDDVRLLYRMYCGDE